MRCKTPNPVSDPSVPVTPREENLKDERRMLVKDKSSNFSPSNQQIRYQSYMGSTEAKPIVTTGKRNNRVLGEGPLPTLSELMAGIEKDKGLSSLNDSKIEPRSAKPRSTSTLQFQHQKSLPDGRGSVPPAWENTSCASLKSSRLHNLVNQSTVSARSVVLTDQLKVRLTQSQFSKSPDDK